MKDVCFLSVAFGEKYIEQQVRLKESILHFYPEANLIFRTEEYPPGSVSMSESLYGFKPHAVLEAKNLGYKKIFWLDTAMIMVDKIDLLLEIGAAVGIVAVKDETLLSKVISDRYLKDHGTTRESLDERDYHLVGGSMYLFDFDHPITEIIFGEWLDDEMNGFFGSQAEEASEQLQGHRADETCMAMCLYQYKRPPIDRNLARYNNETNSIFIKKHFK